MMARKKGRKEASVDKSVLTDSRREDDNREDDNRKDENRKEDKL